MNSLNQPFNQSTSLQGHSAQNSTDKIRKVCSICGQYHGKDVEDPLDESAAHRPNQTGLQPGQNGPMQPLPQLDMPNGQQNSVPQYQYPNYGFGQPSVSFMSQGPMSPISPQMFQNIQNYAGSLAQTGQALANSAQALAQEVQIVQNMGMVSTPFPGNSLQGFQPSPLSGDGMIGSAVPMPYSDSQISQFGFNSQGMPVRIPTEMQQQYAQQQSQQRVQNADGSYTVFTTTRQRGQRAGQGQGQGQNGEANRNPREQTRTNVGEQQRRAKSVPRKIEKDPFEGLEGGLYSKGEVARNRERRELAARGLPVQGGDWRTTDRGRGGGGGGGVGGGGGGTDRARRGVQTLAAPGGQGGGENGQELGPDGVPLDGTLGASFRNRNYLEDEEEDQVPAAGYSGHIPAYKRISVGKNFHTAALEAKKEYIKQRYGEKDLGDSVQAVRGGVQFDESSPDWLNPQLQNMGISGQQNLQSNAQNLGHNVHQYANEYAQQGQNYIQQGQNYVHQLGQGMQPSRSMNNVQQYANYNPQNYQHNVQNLPY